MTSWKPADMSLWQFLELAVTGPLLSANGVANGMMFAYLNSQGI